VHILLHMLFHFQRLREKSASPSNSDALRRALRPLPWKPQLLNHLIRDRQRPSMRPDSLQIVKWSAGCTRGDEGLAGGAWDCALHGGGPRCRGRMLKPYAGVAADLKPVQTILTQSSVIDRRQPRSIGRSYAWTQALPRRP